MALKSPYLLAFTLLFLAHETTAQERRPKAEPSKVLLDAHGDPLPEHAIQRLGSDRWHGAGRLAYASDVKTIVVIEPINIGPFRMSRLDAKTGKKISETELETFRLPLCVHVASDDKVLILAVNKLFDEKVTVFLIDATANKTLGREGFVTAAAISADAKMVAAGHFGFRVWDAATGKEIRTFRGPKTGTFSLAFSPDGKLIAAGAGPEPGYVGEHLPAEIEVVEVASGRVVHRLQGHSNRVLHLAFSPDGKTLVSSGLDKLVRHWDVKAGKELATWNKLEAGAIAFSPDGRILALSKSGGRIDRLDPETGKTFAVPPTHTNSVYAVAFAPGGNLLVSGASDQTVRLWDVKSGQQLMHVRGDHRERRSTSLAFAPDGKTFASADEDGLVSVWDVATKKRLQQCEPKASMVSFAHDGQYLAMGQPLGTSVYLWNVKAKKVDREVTVKGRVASMIAASTDRLLATGEEDGVTRIWDVKTGDLLHTLKDSRGEVLALSLSADAKLLAASVDGQAIQLWDTGSGKDLRRIKLPGARKGVSEHTALALSPDGKMIACVAPAYSRSSRGPFDKPVEDVPDHAILIYDTASGKRLGALQGHRSNVVSLAFSDNGRHLASGSHDANVLIWDIKAFLNSRRE